MYDSYLQTDDTERNQTEKGAEKLETEVTIPHLEEWKKFNTTPYFFDDQYCLIREKRIPLSEKRGKYRYNDFLTAVAHWQKTEVQHPLSTKGFEAHELFFFDTETTGLGGGAGNTIFLLGYASINENEVIIKQHLLPKPGNEVPLYHSFLKSINYTTLVTYNGKAFDWPQVKTRHTFVREHVPKLPRFGHFDLLHASRRLWKHKLDSVKLSIVEKEILEINRTDDIPGFLAPMIYFDFVETNQIDGIQKVMEHNEDDILSLIILYTHISFQLLGLDQKQTKKEQLTVGKWYASLQESKQAIQVLEAALKNYHGEEKWLAAFELAMQYKKLRDMKRAVPLWLEIVHNSTGKVKIQACIEVAKYFEHDEKNIEQALELTEMALEEFTCFAKKHTRFPKQFLQDLSKRLDRLERKLTLFPR